MADPQVDFSLLADLENDARIRSAREMQLGPDVGPPAAPDAERGPWNAFVPVQVQSAGFLPADGQPQPAATKKPGEEVAQMQAAARQWTGVPITTADPAKVPAAAAKNPGEEVAQAQAAARQWSGPPITGQGSADPAKVPAAAAKNPGEEWVQAPPATGTPGTVPYPGPIDWEAIDKFRDAGKPPADPAQGDEATQWYLGRRTGAGDATNNWITAGSAKTADALYGRAAELINPAVTTPLDNTADAANSILRQRVDALQGPGWRAPPPAADALMSVKAALYRTGGMTYEEIKTLRDSMREKMNGAGPEAQKELQAIEQGLTADLRAAAKAGGGYAAEAYFNQAENAVKFAEQRIGKLKAIIGVDGKASPEQVFDRLSGLARSSSQADISTLAQARRVVQPQYWNDFASGLVARLGSAENGAFSLEHFARSYAELSPDARSVLFRSAGKGNLVNSLDDIAAVASRWKQVENVRATDPAATSGPMVVDAVKDPFTTVGSLFGGRAVEQALAHPATASPIARWMRAHVELVASPSRYGLTEFDHASRLLAETMEKAFGTQVSASDLSSVLKIPRALE